MTRDASAIENLRYPFRRRLASAFRVLLAFAVASAIVATATRAAAQQAGEVVGHTRAWPAMGTLFEVTVWTRDSARARAALADARRAVVHVDSLMSTYRPSSELSVVNRRAGTGIVTLLSSETATVLASALAYARASRGAFDPTVLPIVDAWGFKGRGGPRPLPARLDSARALVGYSRVSFDPLTRTVLLPRSGMRLDFGGIAKGYALDLAAAAIVAHGVAHATLDLGGNIRAVGGGPPDDWIVGIRDPFDPAMLLGTLVVPGGAVSTSGDYERFFEEDGIRYGHILDPRTGRPARGVASVTVIAPTGMDSDALSTALFVLGPKAGCAFLRDRPAVSALWVLDVAVTRAGSQRVRRRGRLLNLVVTPGFRLRFNFDRGDSVADPRVRECGTAVVSIR